MCLSFVDSEIEPVEQGYKVFHKHSNGNLSSPVFQSKTIPIGEWLNEEDFRCVPLEYKEWREKKNLISAVNGELYPIGWHSYIDIPSTAILEFRNYNISVSIRRVSIKEVLATGSDLPQRKIVVSKYIKVEEELDDQDKASKEAKEI